MPVLIRRLWWALTGLVRALFGTVIGLLLVATLTLNLAMVVMPAVFNAVSGIVWSMVSVVSSATSARRATQATTNAALRADSDELARTRAQAAAAEADLETKRARVAVVESDNRRLATERARARTQLAASEAEHSATRSRLAQVETDNARLRTSVQTAESRLDDMASRQARARANARTITGRMQGRSVRMVSRNTASTFVETLPVIGGVAVVATLTWDVYDTCQQLNDLRELQTALELDDGAPSDVESRWCGLPRDEILSRLAGRATPTERACAIARVQTQTLNPPECAGFPVELPDYGDPLERPPPTLAPLPDYSFD